MKDRYILMPLASEGWGLPGGWGVYDTQEMRSVQVLNPFPMETFEEWVARLNRVVDEYNEEDRRG